MDTGNSQPLPSGYRICEQAAALLGAAPSDNGVILPFFNRRLEITSQGVRDLAQAPVTPAIARVVTRYLAGSPDPLPGDTGKWVTFREFSGASPLFARFTSNTAKTVEQSFSNDLSGLSDRCRTLEAEALDSPGFSLSMRFSALPRIPIRLNFNETDGPMPATASFLYQDTAICFLALKDLMTTCTWLTSMLIR